MNDFVAESEFILPEDGKPSGSQGPGSSLILAGEVLPEFLAILPLSNRPLFPGLIVPLVYEGAEHVQKTIRKLKENEQQYVGMVLVKNEDAPFTASNLYPVGVVARILKAAEIADHGLLHLVVECLERFQIEKVISAEPPVSVRVHYHLETSYRDNMELRAYMVAIINTIKELLKHNPLHEEELKLFLSRFGPDEPSRLADFAASLTTADREELQDVLETFPIFERLKKVMTLLNREVNVSKLQSRIRKRIDERISEQQRKFFLKEQLHEIKRELGMEMDEKSQEAERLKARLKGLKLSDEARERFDEEMQKLEILDPASPEYGVARNYLDLLTQIPWGKYVRDRYNLKAAAKTLNRDHAGLEDVKDRILEFIAIGARKKEVGGSIILFVGPPGVGKTSIGRAVAEAIGRPFYRFSVGGMHDEAEIKGHRRTYIGAMPGKIIQALKQVKAANPVIMIDEVDKIGTDFRGDPASALLEVLDPEQNSDFLDHYLDVRFDLSRVLFLLTANQLDTVPSPLLDRAEVIRLPGYVGFEKRIIGRKHLWPRQLKAHGLSRDEVQLTDAALHHLIEDYAREPGVRQLERLMKKILRKAARKLTEDENRSSIRIGVRDLEPFVGQPRFREKHLRCDIGIATGLAWTAMGGTSLTLEALIAHQDKRGLKLTGQLGKVMQESAEIAFSFVGSNLSNFGAKTDFFDTAFIHLHVPEGAVPKDGPSAGITMATALLSLALNKAPAPIAMTGEMTLTGDVLPIGGVREKLLAVKRLSLEEVILPKANQVDVDELPDKISGGLKIHYVSHYNDVARLMFGIRPRKK